MLDTTLLPSEPGHIVHNWTKRYGFLWLKKKTITVEAKQFPVSLPCTFETEMTAKVTIYEGMNQVEEIYINHALLPGDEMLGLQVYAYAVNPKNNSCSWKKILLKFCRLCKGFNQQGKPQWVLIFWADGPVTIRKIGAD